MPAYLSKANTTGKVTELRKVAMLKQAMEYLAERYPAISRRMPDIPVKLDPTISRYETARLDVGDAPSWAARAILYNPRAIDENPGNSFAKAESLIKAVEVLAHESTHAMDSTQHPEWRRWMLNNIRNQKLMRTLEWAGLHQSAETLYKKAPEEVRAWKAGQTASDGFVKALLKATKAGTDPVSYIKTARLLKLGLPMLVATAGLGYLFGGSDDSSEA